MKIFEPMSPLDAITWAVNSVSLARVDHPALGVQERVLCYEIYHKLRVLEDGGFTGFYPAIVQAELNKSGQRKFYDTMWNIYRVEGRDLDWRVAEAMPDLLIHHPGDDQWNLAVLEAKRADTQPAALRWDLAKLALFAGDILQYELPVLLVFDGYDQDPENALRAVQALGTPEGARIHVISVSLPHRRFAFGEVRFDIPTARQLFESVAREREEKRRQAKLAGSSE